MALGHRRLSIIDLSTGDQPIYNEDRTKAVIFNGEIYNFRELRAELEARGHRFATASDTEAIVHAWEEYGRRAASRRLRGMFAFALWDCRARRLLLARDRVGKKPLYYVHDGERLALRLGAEGAPRRSRRSSERISLGGPRRLPHVRRGAGAARRSTRRSQQLPPAHYLVWEDGRIRLREYWDLVFRSGGAARRRPSTSRSSRRSSTRRSGSG